VQVSITRESVMTHPSMFSRTLQATQTWIRELQEQMKETDENRVYDGMRAVLHQLRDRLTVDEAADFAAQLPTLMRGIYFEGWDPSRTPERIRSREEFIAGVQAKLSTTPDVDAELATLAVFAVISRHITPGEVRDVRSMLPGDMQALWPKAA